VRSRQARAERRALVYALASSLALHAAVLALRFETLRDAAAHAPQLIVRVIALEPPRTALPAAKRSIARRAERLAPVPVPDEPAVAEAVWIARHRQQLIGAAARYKSYPQEALDAGAEGEVLVRIAYASDGAAQVRLGASSGEPLLDEQALVAFRAAAPQVPVPLALRGREFEFAVRAIYSRD
jgi:protein TonB